MVCPIGNVIMSCFGTLVSVLQFYREHLWDGYCGSSDIIKFFVPGPGLALKGEVFPNHGVLQQDPSVIGEDENALYCVTDDVTCCVTPSSADCCGTTDSRTGTGGSGNGQGNWYYPNGDPLPSGNEAQMPFLWYARWLTGAVLMNFRGSADTGTTGLHRCDIQDSMGILHQFYTCIYKDNGDSDCKPVTMCMYV